MENLRIELKPATADDIPSYALIARSVESPTYLAITDPTDILEQIKRSMVFMIRSEDKDIGYVSYEPRSGIHAYISELAVHPDFHGRGIGNQALDILKAELLQKGYKVMSLVTHPNNPAKRLYERHGFVITGRIENYENSGTPRLKLVWQTH